jgi:hypothetical protein
MTGVAGDARAIRRPACTGKIGGYAHRTLPARTRVLECHQEGDDEGKLQMIVCVLTVLRGSLFNPYPLMKQQH